ncbi:MAG: DsbA family protein [Defluviitaleaceae bacterium]|nr:DsbA family protein [Defluviitaleaceae bacterium]
MKKVEVFFDYNCPFCLKGHDQLKALTKEKPDLEITWHPCEISEYKNNFTGTHTDISLQGLYFVLDNGVDVWQYHQRVYDMIFKDRTYTQDVDSFVKAFDGFLDTAALAEALKSGKYTDKLKESNQFAFTVTGVHVVPTYRTDGGYLQDRQEFYGMGTSDTSYNGTK